MLQVVVWQVHAGLAADRKAAGNLRRRSIDVDLGDHWPLAHIFGHDRQIEPEVEALLRLVGRSREVEALPAAGAQQPLERHLPFGLPFGTGRRIRSEEHTSELQSLMRISYAVFCLKKK